MNLGCRQNLLIQLCKGTSYELLGLKPCRPAAAVDLSQDILNRLVTHRETRCVFPLTAHTRRWLLSHHTLLMKEGLNSCSSESLLLLLKIIKGKKLLLLRQEETTEC